MKRITLSIAERLQLLGFLNGFQGKSYETLTDVWKLIEKIKVTEEEKARIELKIEGTSIIWNKDKAGDVSIELTSDEEKAFNDEFEKQSKESKLGADSYNLAQIYIKLKDAAKE